MKMPRPKNHILHNLLNVNHTDAKRIVCNKGNCNGKLLRSHTGNLVRHLKVAHPELYSTYIRQKNGIQSNSKQTPKLKSKDLNQTNIELAIMELFTKNGHPLDMIEDRAFQILVQPAFDALNIRINKHNINERIIAFSQKIKSEIIDDLKGKLLSLEINGITKQDLSVLGINVQYIKNQSIEIKTLAVKELTSSHTSEYLKSIILEVLKEYAIDLNQIFTITTYNGANMLNTVRNIDLTISLKEESIDNILEESVDNIWEESVHSSLTEEKFESIGMHFSSQTITGVHCGVDTLQLCVNDVLEKAEIKEKIEKCRLIIKKLRAPPYLSILQNSSCKEPILDCSTIWNSTYKMLESLLKIKKILDSLSTQHENLYLSPEVWDFVYDFTKIFKSVYIATLKLQSEEQLCFSELYVIIMDISFRIESLPATEMATLLKDALNKRKEELFNNDLFNAAVFLDPRIKICMTAERKGRAKKYITCLYERMNHLKETTTNVNGNSLADEDMSQSSITNFPPKSFAEYLQNLDPETKIIDNSLLDEDPRKPLIINPSPKSFSEFLQNLDPGSLQPTSSCLTQLESDLMIYEKQSRLPLDSNIVQFWSEQNNSLSAIADIILAIPFTQASVERLFSALKYIFSEQRPTFSLEHILIVKLNGIFNYEG